MSTVDLISITALVRKVQSEIPDIEAIMLEDNQVEFLVPKNKIRKIVTLLDESVQMLFPECVFGVDLGDDKYHVRYILYSHLNNFICHLRVDLEGSELSIETTSDIFPAFEWHERETHEMYGIKFEGHPDLRLLLLPDELEGQYPLRKSFVTDRSRLAESGLPQPKPRPERGGAKE
ncbi:MAG: NADH-quinone oxidoreductase subunit C [Candidatus Thorarchaeota archaeon]|jgi:NADH-quinone oxidoreductase subunit C